MANRSEEKKPEALWVLPSDIPEYYTNSINVAVSVFDFTFVIGTTEVDGSSTPKLKLRMSPQHAWVFSKILENTLKKYIEVSGNIPIREEFLKEKGLFDIYMEEFGESNHE